MGCLTVTFDVIAVDGDGGLKARLTRTASAATSCASFCAQNGCSSPTRRTWLPDWGAAVKYALANCPGQTNVEIAY